MTFSEKTSPRRRALRPLPARSALTVLLLSALLLPWSSCSLPDETAAVVNDRKIATEDLEEVYMGFLDQFGELVPPGADEAGKTRRALLDRLIDRELMLQEVARMNLQPSEEDVSAEAERLRGNLGDREFEAVLSEAGLSREQWREKVAQDLAVERLQQEAVYGMVEVTPKEIDDYRRLHRNSYELPEEVRASQILVRTREEAKEAARRIRGGEKFADMAREVSLSPDAEVGGDLGYFARGQMPQEFDAVVFSLPVGKVSSVVETTYGHHLFLVTDHREARRRSEEEIAVEVRRRLISEKNEKTFGRWLESLRKNARIRYNENVVAR